MVELTKEGLLQRAEEVKIETTKGANTATRVGGLLEDMITYLSGLTIDTGDLSVAVDPSNTDYLRISVTEGTVVTEAKIAISELITLLSIGSKDPIILANGDSIPAGKTPEVVYISIPGNVAVTTSVIAPTGYYLNNIMTSIPAASPITALTYKGINITVTKNSIYKEYLSTILEAASGDALVATGNDATGFNALLEYRKYRL